MYLNPASESREFTTKTTKTFTCLAQAIDGEQAYISVTHHSISVIGTASIIVANTVLSVKFITRQIDKILKMSGTPFIRI